jgi:hypothetical protein
MIASFVIRNSESFAVKDIDVVCEPTAKSGTPIGFTANTLFHTVPAHDRLARFPSSTWVPRLRSTAAKQHCLSQGRKNEPRVAR